MSKRNECILLRNMHFSLQNTEKKTPPRLLTVRTKDYRVRATCTFAMILLDLSPLLLALTLGSAPCLALRFDPAARRLPTPTRKPVATVKKTLSKKLDISPF